MCQFGSYKLYISSYRSHMHISELFPFVLSKMKINWTFNRIFNQAMFSEPKCNKNILYIDLLYIVVQTCTNTIYTSLLDQEN